MIWLPVFVMAIFVAYQAAKSRFQDAKIRCLEATVEALQRRPALEPVVEERPLEGLRVAVDVSQDYARPVFAELLVERLSHEGAEAVVGLFESADVVVRGSLVCNGYADLFVSAELVCELNGEAVAYVTERPQEGRQVNLAATVVARLKSAVAKSRRQAAMRELREP